MKKIIMVIMILLGTINIANSKEWKQYVEGDNYRYNSQIGQWYSDEGDEIWIRFLSGWANPEKAALYGSTLVSTGDIYIRTGDTEPVIITIADPDASYIVAESLKTVIENIVNNTQVYDDAVVETVKETIKKNNNKVNVDGVIYTIENNKIVVYIPPYIKKKSKADKVVDTLTGKNKNLNSLGDINRFLETYGNIYIDVTIYENDETTVRLQHKNEQGDEYTGIKITRSVDFNCILFGLCRK